MACNPNAQPPRWVLATERATGRGHPILADTINRPLRDFLTALGIDPDLPFDACTLGGLIGGGVTTRKIEWIAEPFYGQGSVDSPWNGFAYEVHGLPFSPSGAVGGGTAWVNIGGAGVVRVASSIKVIDMTPTATAEVMHVFRPSSGAATPPTILDFYADSMPIVGTITNAPIPMAYVIEAWIRKKLSGDGTAARQFFGFLAVSDPDFSKRSCMVGLLGDGASGFRFGSLNCPDAPGSATQNGATDIDTGAVQPAGLVSPAGNFFHIKIKMVPPIPGVQSGRVGCYLNKVLSVTYLTSTNFPRRSRSPIDVLLADYVSTQAGFAVWPNPNGSTVDPGLYFRDVRFSYDEDTSL